jgi:BolA protein
MDYKELTDSDLLKEHLHKEKRLIQTPDSLIHMIIPTQKTKTSDTYISDSDSQDEEVEEEVQQNLSYPDVLFIDEIESLLNYVCTSSTLSKKRQEVFTILNEYIKHAKYVFLVDSNVTIPVCNYIKSLRSGHNVNVIFNKKKTNDTKYYICHDECYWTQRVMAVVKKGKKIFIGCDSKKQTEMLESQLIQKNLKVKVYNCDTDDHSRKMLKHVNQEWNKFDVVIVSPTIVYGVDFNKVHFDYVFGYYTKTITASSVYQQLNRIRKITEKEAYIYVQEYHNNNVHPMPTTIQGLEKYYFRYQSECKKEFEKLSLDCTQLKKLNLSDHFTKLYLHFMCEINRCENDFMSRLIRFLTEFGGKVYDINGFGNDPNFLKNKKELNGQITDITNEKLVKASKLIENAREINEKKYKTSDEKRILTAHKICKELNLNKLTVDFLNSLGHIRNVEKVTESFKYFDDNSKVIKQTTDNIDGSLALLMKKKHILTSGMTLFYQDGILTNETITVPKSALTEEQKKWWETNGDDLLYCFKSLRQDRIKVVNQVQLYNIIQKIKSDVLCNFNLDMMKRKTRQINKVKHVYFECNSCPTSYVELLLNAKKSLPTDLLESFRKFADVPCNYTKIHNKQTIGDLIKKFDLKKDENEFYKNYNAVCELEKRNPWNRTDLTECIQNYSYSLMKIEDPEKFNNVYQTLTSYKQMLFEQDLKKAFSVEHLQIEDESHLHAGHAGAASGGGHFKLTIIAPEFKGLNLVARHRAVYAALNRHIPLEIHALTIHAMAPGEAST